jgi:predicted Zn-dependent protease
VLFALCVARPARADDLSPLPSAYGIYALDHGELKPLLSYSWGVTAADQKQRQTFSSGVSLVVYAKWIGDSKLDPKSIWLCDWRTMDDEPRPKMNEVTAQVKDHPDMVTVTLPGGFKPGLYSLGMRKEDYRFGVETTDTEAFWQSALEGGTNRWHAHEYLGAACFQRSDLDGALDHWKRCVELKPSLYETHNNYALALMAKGRPDEAVSEYKAAVDLDGGQAAVRINYADALRMARRVDEANVQYQEAARLFFNDGVSCSSSGKWDGAISAFKEALKLKPDYAEAQQQLDMAEKHKQDGSKQ